MAAADAVRIHPLTIPLICFYKTETPASGSDAGVLGGRGWIARAAHLKKPRRGFFAAGTDGGGRCCSNPPATIPLICFYKTETPAPGSDTGVLGGRGWIARAAHLKKPRRGFFARRTDSAGRCCSNPPATSLRDRLSTKQKLQHPVRILEFLVERSNPNPNHCPLGHLWRRFHRK